MRILFTAAVWLAGALASAAPIRQYEISVHPSSIAGVAGFIDLQFNAGLPADAATAVVSAFSSDGTAGPIDPSSFNSITWARSPDP